MRLWLMFFASQERQRLCVEPQTSLSDLPGFGAELTDQASQKAGSGKA